MLRSIFIPFDVEFQGNIERISRSVNIYQQEVELAHIKHSEYHIQSQDQRSRNIVAKLDAIVLTVPQDSVVYQLVLYCHFHRRLVLTVTN